MERVELPSPAEVLRQAYQLASIQAGPDTAFAERAKALVMIARELREGSRAPERPTEAAILAALTAFGIREPVDRWVTPDTCPDITNDRTVHIPVYRDLDEARAAGAVPLDYGQRIEDDPAATATLHTEQPMPVPNGRGSIQALVRHDLVERERVGVQRYGTPLQAFNGRSALRDLYEELLDAACYARQMIAEEEGQPTPST